MSVQNGIGEVYKAKGFFSKTQKEVEQTLREIVKGDDLRIVPMDFVSESMTYYVTKKGEVYFSHKFKGYYYTQESKKSARYAKGLKIKVSIGNHQTREIWMHDIMYWTYVLGYSDRSLEICLKDGNKYNYSLDNLYVKNKYIKDYVPNMISYSDVYKNEFMRICLEQSFRCRYIEYQDLQDIVSDSFFEICNRSRTMGITNDNFIGQWIQTVKRRIIDDEVYYHGRLRPLLEKNCISEDKIDFLDDILKNVKGEKTTEYVRMWSMGYTPTDIAEELNSTISSVGSVITHTCEKLRKVYKKDIKILRYDK